MKTTRHSLLAKGILVLLSLLILVFIFTYSWYAPPTIPAFSRGVQVNTKSDADFEYAIGFYNSETGGNYKMTAFSNSSETLDLEHLNVPGEVDENTGDPIDYNLLVDYRPIDVTGDGATLIRPSMQYGNSDINFNDNNYSIAEPNVQYISFDLILRSANMNPDIKLGSGSFAKGAVELTSGVLTGANVGNKSLNGAFSKDAVVGAIRVAFVEYDDNLTAANLVSNTDEYLEDEATLLWLPRPDIKLVEGNTDSNWTLSTNLTRGSSAANYSIQYTLANNTITYSTNTFTHTYYNIFNGPQNSANHNIVGYTDTVTDLTTSQRIATISIPDTNNVIDSTTYNYTKVKVRIWVEGTDLESRRTISGGQFDVNFELTSK